MSKPQAIGFYFTCMTVHMATSGVLRPNLIKVDSDEQALIHARECVKDGTDPHEAHLGCLTVYADGSVQLDEFSLEDMDVKEDEPEEDSKMQTNASKSEKKPEQVVAGSSTMPLKLEHLILRSETRSYLEIYLPSEQDQPDSVSVYVKANDVKVIGCQMPLPVLAEAVYDAVRRYQKAKADAAVGK